MGEVQAAFSRDEKLAPYGWLAIVEGDLQSGRGSRFRGTEASGATADDRELGVRVQSRVGIRQTSIAPELVRRDPRVLSLLEMDRVAFRSKRGLVDHLAHGWMGVDGGVNLCGGEFLVEGEAHLGDQFGGVFPDDMSA